MLYFIMTERSVKIKSSIYQKQEGRGIFLCRFANGGIETANGKRQIANCRSFGNVIFVIVGKPAIGS
jgi:hypothetical protein